MDLSVQLEERILELDCRRAHYMRYLLVKVEERDWHGVADCAMDLREIEAEQGAILRLREGSSPAASRLTN